jgi:hypothetical protein
MTYICSDNYTNIVLFITGFSLAIIAHIWVVGSIINSNIKELNEKLELYTEQHQSKQKKLKTV